MIQSLRTADSHGVTGFVARDWADMLGPLGADGPNRIAVAVAKSDRFPAEMREIAATQEAAGRGAELYEAIARVFEASYATRLGELTPEQAGRVTELDRVTKDLRTPRALRPGQNLDSRARRAGLSSRSFPRVEIFSGHLIASPDGQPIRWSFTSPIACMNA